MGVIIKSIFSFVIIFVIVKPIFSLTFENFDTTFTNVSEDIILQNSYINYAIDEKQVDVSRQIQLILKEQGISEAEVNTICNFDQDIGIKIDVIIINLEKAVIISDKEHIDIIEIINKTICELFEVNQKDIVIYE